MIPFTIMDLVYSDISRKSLFHVVRGSVRGSSSRVYNNIICQSQYIRINFMHWLDMPR